MTQPDAAAVREGPTPAPVPKSGPRARRMRLGDLLLATLARGSAVIIILMLVALLAVLIIAAFPTFQKFGFGFVLGDTWRPVELITQARDAEGNIIFNEDGEPEEVIIPPVFGALPVMYGTAVSSAIALLVAVPLSLGAALFLVRVAPKLRIAGPLSFLVEFLAAIPSLAYGIWGFWVLAPFLREHVQPPLARLLEGTPAYNWLFTRTVTEFDGRVVTQVIPSTGLNMLCGGLILAIMILPIITAVSRDVLKAVPRAQIEGSLALGATWWQSSWGMLRYGRSGLFGAVILGLARAAGETMAVTMVIGNQMIIAASPFAPSQTMASLLANEYGEASDLKRSSLLAVALILLVMSLTFNVLARWLVVGGQSRSAAAH